MGERKMEETSLTVNILKFITIYDYIYKAKHFKMN